MRDRLGCLVKCDEVTKTGCQILEPCRVSGAHEEHGLERDLLVPGYRLGIALGRSRWNPLPLWLRPIVETPHSAAAMKGSERV